MTDWKKGAKYWDISKFPPNLQIRQVPWGEKDV